MRLADPEVVERGFLGLGRQPPGVDLLSRQDALGVQSLDPLGLILGLGGLGLLLGDLRPQQGVVQLDDDLALAHPGALLHHHLGHAIAVEVGVDRRLLARHQQAGGHQAAGQRPAVDAHDMHHARRSLSGGRRPGRGFAPTGGPCQSEG